MVPSHYTILRLWAVADDSDWYGLLCLENGFTPSEAKRRVRQALHFYGFSPKTSREYAAIRQLIREGGFWADELI
jgi:hypothetical protein